MTATPNDRLLARVRSISAPEAQNRLMRIADRELALSMFYMEERDRRRLLSLVAREKARRISEEIGLQAHLAVRYDQYRIAVENVIRQLGAASGSSPLRSYLRPRGRRRG